MDPCQTVSIQSESTFLPFLLYIINIVEGLIRRYYDICIIYDVSISIIYVLLDKFWDNIQSSYLEYNS